MKGTAMKIHDYKGFPNPARVRIALAEKGLADRVAFVKVDVPAGEHKRPAFLAKNPSGVVPVLELEDGTALSESSAIIEYLDHLEGEPVLTGRTAKERGVIAMIQRKVETGFLDAVAAYFHHSTPDLGPHIETYQNRDWGEKNRERALSTLRWMERLLGGQDFLVGERLTSADITAFAGFLLADSVKIPLPDDCPGVRAYRERLARHPSVAAALA
jgi:glutathione S-transferase